MCLCLCQTVRIQSGLDPLCTFTRASLAPHKEGEASSQFPSGFYYLSVQRAFLHAEVWGSGEGSQGLFPEALCVSGFRARLALTASKDEDCDYFGWSCGILDRMSLV